MRRAISWLVPPSAAVCSRTRRVLSAIFLAIAANTGSGSTGNGEVRASIAKAVAGLEQPGDVEARWIVDRAQRVGDADHPCAELVGALGSGGTDGTEALDHDRHPGELPAPVGGGGRGRLGDAEAGHAPLVIR